LDSNSEIRSSTRSTGTFLWGEMARNQSGRLSGSMWRNSNGTFFSRSRIAERCTHGQVLKLTSRYFDIDCLHWRSANRFRMLFATFYPQFARIAPRTRAMTASPADPDIIRDYHAHVYYDPSTTRDRAERLRARVAAAFPQA